MTEQAKHSRLPWTIDPDDREGYEWNVHIVQEYDHDMRVCFMTSGPEAQANAAFIVRAANAHEALVEALKTLSETYDGIWAKMSDGEMALVKAAWAKADAALKLAEGQP